jgi:hypothetical protein
MLLSLKRSHACSWGGSFGGGKRGTFVRVFSLRSDSTATFGASAPRKMRARYVHSKKCSEFGKQLSLNTRKAVK